MFCSVPSSNWSSKFPSSPKRVPPKNDVTNDWIFIGMCLAFFKRVPSFFLRGEVTFKCCQLKIRWSPKRSLPRRLLGRTCKQVCWWFRKADRISIPFLGTCRAEFHPRWYLNMLIFICIWIIYPLAFSHILRWWLGCSISSSAKVWKKKTIHVCKKKSNPVDCVGFAWEPRRYLAMILAVSAPDCCLWDCPWPADRGYGKVEPTDPVKNAHSQWEM